MLPLERGRSGIARPGLRLGLDLAGIGGRMAHAWGTLPGYVRTGSPAYHERFGRSFWDDLDAHPEIGASFDALMGPAGHGAPNVDFDITGGWESVRSMVDVGGGTGAMLAELMRKWPKLQGRWSTCRGQSHSQAKSSRRPAWRPGHHGRPELFRPLAVRGGCLSAEKGPGQLA